jgi:hypothetical protein
MMKRIAAIALFALLCSVSVPNQTKPKDVLGWEETRWGMTSDEIGKALGSRAQKLTDSELYGDGYYDYLVPDITLQSSTFTALLIMDRETRKLSRVDVRLNQYESQKPPRDIFDALDAMLIAQYGAPDAKKDEPSSDQVHLSHIWRLQTSTVELWLYWDNRMRPVSSNVGISYYPTAAVKNDGTEPNVGCDSRCIASTMKSKDKDEGGRMNLIHDIPPVIGITARFAFNQINPALPKSPSISSLKDVRQISLSGEMFIATQLSLLISPKSEMLSISLFADKVRKPCTFYKHSMPTARLCSNSFARLLLREAKSSRSVFRPFDFNDSCQPGVSGHRVPDGEGRHPLQ